MARVEMIRLRLAVSVILALMGVFDACTARAQQATKVPRIGILATNLTSAPHMLEAFRRGLLERGWAHSKTAGQARGTTLELTPEAYIRQYGAGNLTAERHRQLMNGRVEHRDP